MIWQIKLAATLVLALALFWGYNYIGEHAVSQYKQEQIVLQAKADKITQTRYDDLAADYVILKAQRTTKYKTITRTVEKLVQQPAYQVPCITQEGVEAANRALGGAHE